MRLTVLFILISLILAGCANSLVYSPALNLSHKPIAEKEVDIQAGVEMMPETRPSGLKGRNSTVGINGKITYGFSNSFNLALSAWGDIEGRDSFIRTGYSLNAQFIDSLNPSSRIIIIPRIGLLFTENQISAYGLTTSIVYQKELNRRVGYYLGGGIIWGYKSFYLSKNKNNEERLPMGFGLLANLGFVWQMSDAMRLNAEINPVYQINTFDKNQQLIISPQIGIAYTIR